jgi:hypothetical protein
MEEEEVLAVAAPGKLVSVSVDRPPVATVLFIVSMIPK